MGSYSGVEKIAAKKTGVSVEVWIKNRKKGLLWCYCCKSWKRHQEFGDDSSRSTKKTSACKSCISFKGTACRYKIGIEKARSLRKGNKVCRICKRKKKLEVDHDHKTGKIRGSLCGRCNKGLGLFKDSPMLLKRAIGYLEKNNEK